MINDNIKSGLNLLNVSISEVEDCIATLQADGRAVIFSGSLAEGYANPRSDIDLILIAEDIDAVVNGRFVHRGKPAGLAPVYGLPLLFFTLDCGTRIQVTVLPVAWVNGVRSKMTRFYEHRKHQARTGERLPFDGDEFNVSSYEMEMYHRIIYSLSNTRNPLVDELISEFNARDFSEYLLLWRSWLFDSSSDDYLGLLESDIEIDPLTLGHAAYECLRIIGLMLLASTGSTKVSEKFLFRLLAQARNQIGDEILDEWTEAIESVFASPQPSDKIVTCLNRIMSRCENISPLLAQYRGRIGRRVLAPA